MKIPQLDITYYKSNIIIEQTDPKMRISGQVGDFSLEKQERQFEINQTKPKLTIDNYPAQKQLHHQSRDPEIPFHTRQSNRRKQVVARPDKPHHDAFAYDTG